MKKYAIQNATQPHLWLGKAIVPPGQMPWLGGLEVWVEYDFSIPPEQRPAPHRRPILFDEDQIDPLLAASGEAFEFDGPGGKGRVVLIGEVIDTKNEDRDYEDA